MPLTHNINRLSDISYLVSIGLDNEDALDMKCEFDRDLINSSHVEGFRKGKAPLHEVYRAREYDYDVNGNLTRKKILEGDDWIQYNISYSHGSHITDVSFSISSGSVAPSSIVPAYDVNGNLTNFPAFTITNGPSQFQLSAMSFTYDRKNRLASYTIDQMDTRTLKWDALGRIREKSWGSGHDYHKQVFYHDGRTLMQIWNEVADMENVTRDIAYDLYLGETGYLKDIDFDSDPDNEGYLIKDAQGSVRAIVNIAHSNGEYTVTTARYNTDGYGAWLNFDDPHSNGTHYMRYISCRVEDYANPGSTHDNQALIHTDHRHYLPWLGIFLQREPKLTNPSCIQTVYNYAKNPARLHPYTYSECKPTIVKDPSGLSCDQKYLENICDARFNNDNSLCLAEYWDNRDLITECFNAYTKYEIDVWDQILIHCHIIAIARLTACLSQGYNYNYCITEAAAVYNACVKYLKNTLYKRIKEEIDKIERIAICWSFWNERNYINCKWCAVDQWCKCCVEADCCCYYEDGGTCDCDKSCPVEHGWGWWGPPGSQFKPPDYQEPPPAVPAVVVTTSCPCCERWSDKVDYPQCPDYGKWANEHLPGKCKPLKPANCMRGRIIHVASI